MFKQLHVWSSKEATGNEEKKKKKSAEPEMGYCPFEHWLGRTRRLSAHGARARGWALGSGGRWGAGARAHVARGGAGRGGAAACRRGE